MDSRLCEFIHILSGKKNLEKSISYIADSLNLGRLIGELHLNPTPAYPDGRYEKTIFYTSDDGFTKEYPFSVSFEIYDPGTVTLTAYSRPGAPIADEQQMKAVMELINLVAEWQFIVRKAEQMGLTQFLTGLPNAGGYMREVSKKFQERVIDQYDAYYFNLNGFGLINKQYGQKQGDEIIKRYAGVLRHSIEEDELIGHLGGDNFVALIKQGKNSRKFQERIRHIETYAELGKEKIPVSISAIAGMMTVEPMTPAEQIISGPAVACTLNLGN